MRRPMPLPLLLSLTLVGVTGAGRAHATPRPAAAARPGETAPPGPPPAGVAGPASSVEPQRLRTELERLNREIDALKQRRGGLGEDFQLRRKLADAEALARRLTELERRGQSAANPRPPAAPLGDAPVLLAPPPRASPSDDREVLDAKADILGDQARRLQQQVRLLEDRVVSLRARQELRRRAGDLDRDPFSPLEQSKRRLPIGSLASGAVATAAPTSGKASAPPADSAGGVAVSGTEGATRGGGQGTFVGATAPGGAAPGTTATLAPTGPAATPPPGNIGGVGNAGNAVNVGVTASVSPVVPVTTNGGDGAPSLANQFRGVLDAATLNEIRRLEAGAPGGASLAATERALEAVRARARELERDAETTRRAARNPP